ncbi:MAG: 2-oxo acid dehydrogenase subunit E2 [Deltaproteobacteria bacterium]|nr:2-oxo acid dehydrogenase subunit E2 [Deltaproteobacteria bacterium]
MPFEFKLPDLGEGIAEGEIVKWLVKEGDIVNEHQPILEIETDKAIVEVPSPKKGRVIKINKAAGDIALVGETLLVLEPEGPEGERPASVSVVGVLLEEEEVLALPKTRSMAKRTGIDLKTIKGTGPGGMITEDDVKAAAEGLKKETKDRFGPIERVQIKGIRKSISRNLIASQKKAASATGMDDCDVTELWALREKEKKTAKEKDVHLTFMPFFMKAVQHALARHPLLNASVDEETEEIIVKKYYNIGVAVDTADGLMVSVVKDVDKKTILELATELQGLSKKARERKITLEELKGSSFTISNFGSFGGVYATPIINYPDVAILGTGRIAERPWVKDNKIEIRKILPLSLTFDHRVIDGSEAALFLNKVMGFLEDPGSLFIESL